MSFPLLLLLLIDTALPADKAPAEIRVQFGGKRTAEDGPAVKGARGDATREAIEAEVADLRKQIQPADGALALGIPLDG